MSQRARRAFNILAGAATVHDGSFLLLRRSARESFLPRAWGIPAGQVLPAEDPSDACLRELHEETGLRGEVIELIGYSTFQSKRADTELSNVQLNFLVYVSDRRVTLNRNSHCDACWIPLDDTESELVDSFTREIMSAALTHLKEIGANGLAHLDLPPNPTKGASIEQFR